MKELERWNAPGDESINTLKTYFYAAVLRRYSGNQCKAARRLGIDRNTMLLHVRKFNLRPLIAQIKEKSSRQPLLFKTPVRNLARPSGWVQDSITLNRIYRRKPEGFSQQSNKATAGSG